MNSMAFTIEDLGDIDLIVGQWCLEKARVVREPMKNGEASNEWVLSRMQFQLPYRSVIPQD